MINVSHVAGTVWKISLIALELNVNYLIGVENQEQKLYAVSLFSGRSLYLYKVLKIVTEGKRPLGRPRRR